MVAWYVRMPGECPPDPPSVGVKLWGMPSIKLFASQCKLLAKAPGNYSTRNTIA